MQHNLTDFDYAVLAALKMGTVRKVRRDAQHVEYTMAGVSIWPSLFRLEQAGELYIGFGQDILFPDSDEYKEAEAVMELMTALKRGIRNGTITLIEPKKPKKGTKP